MEIPDSIEVHTVELTKYHLQEATISSAPAIEQWAFFFLFADSYEPERLRDLLPGVEFQQAISVVEAIAAKTEDRKIYDQRLKAQRDNQWGLDSAREQGRQEGELLGKIRILQELLGEESSSPESLDERMIGRASPNTTGTTATACCHSPRPTRLCYGLLSDPMQYGDEIAHEVRAIWFRTGGLQKYPEYNRTPIDRLPAY